MQIPEYVHIAIKAAIEASDEIMRIYQMPFMNELKSDGSPVTKADLASSDIIHRILSSTNINVIGEEKEHVAYSERKNWKQVWIVDPLDGTKEFIKKNDEFAVNIALVEDGTPVFGLIASPVQQKIICGGRGMGSYSLNFQDVAHIDKWKILSQSNLNSPLVMARSRSHHASSELNLISELKQKYPEVNFIQKGSALKFFDLAEGRADIYPRFAPTMEWDIAAGQAILDELGGIVQHAITGKPLQYNKESLFNPHFIAKTKAFLDDNI